MVPVKTVTKRLVKPLVISKPKVAQGAAVASPVLSTLPGRVAVVKSLWVSASATAVGHKVDLVKNAEVALCGRSVLNSRPYHGMKFCKKCLALSTKENGDAKGPA